MKTLEVVATLCDYPEWHIGRSETGTVVEVLDGDHVLVEFAHRTGIAYATVPMPIGELIQLKDTPAAPSEWGDA
ncbi:DUF4926 domain-containing protein [Thauera humireducens]|uniref:DUF4926 domain-containing protein n=1 Tax=Thauera humireducens TaxID=1134435 RepID=UPI0031201707